MRFGKFPKHHRHLKMHFGPKTQFETTAILGDGEPNTPLVFSRKSSNILSV